MAEKKGTQKTPENPDSGGGQKRIVIITAVIFVFLLIAAIGLFFYLNKEQSTSASADPSSEVPIPELNKNTTIGPMVDIEEFIVNIISGESKHYVKASLTLELTNELAKEEASKRMPQIRDSILLLVGNKTYEELQDLHGKKQLKAELISKLNAILQAGSVKSVYFTDFVVQ